MAKSAILTSKADEQYAREVDAAWLRPAWVEIDLAAIRHNVKVANRLGGGAKLFAVCKGDGYGGGVVEIAHAAVDAGAYGIGVGAPVDAVVLRAKGIRCPMLLYAATLPEDAAAVAALGVIPTIHDFPSLDAFARLSTPVEAFVKIDCGLGRLGFNPEDFAAAFDRLRASPNICLGGIYAHFAVPEDPAAIGRQTQTFDSACGLAERAGFKDFERMVASSRVMLGFPNLNFTAINPGRFILGIMEPPWADKAPFQPAVRALKARIIQIKDQPAETLGFGGEERKKGPVRAAVLPIGYGEGLPHLPPCHEVLVHGKRAAILSRRGIEHTVIDVTRVPEARIGDEAVLLGRQGEDEITADELSRALKVPVLELIPRLARCAPRRYVDAV